MDFSKMSFEEMSEKLGVHSNSKLLKMARGYNIVLPEGLDSKDAILHAMHEALTGAVPAPAVESESSSSSTPAGAGPSIRVLATTGAPRYWRCGVKFGPKWLTFPVSEFTPAQLDELRADKNLRIQDC